MTAIRGPLDSLVDNFRTNVAAKAREQILAELSGGGAPCLWCPGVPVFNTRDRLLAHIHDQHPPADLADRLKATSYAYNRLANQLHVVRLAAGDVDPARVMAALNALDPLETT